MINRRSFIQKAGLLGLAAALGGASQTACTPKTEEKKRMKGTVRKPVVVSTWRHGLDANEAAMAAMKAGKLAVDAAEAGVRVSESDPKVDSVGLGGLPDRTGKVTLDACIMDHQGRCGSVAFLEHIENPISVARLVMEKTPHVMLVGEGALDFALSQGFKKSNLLTAEAEAKWKTWLKENGEWKGDHDHHDLGVEDNHDTIGLLTLDNDGRLSGACTTSGLGYKMRGRVGDSPIIGGGLFVDWEYGAATATGKGEAVIKVCGSHLIVELMRQGKSPMEACRLTVERMWRSDKDPHYNVGFLALSPEGEVGAYSLKPGFEYALYADGKNQLLKSQYLLEK